MKRIICVFIIATTVSCVHAQTERRQEHEWKATVTVLDDNSQPVSGAQVSVVYDVPPPPGQKIAGETITGLTDTNGVLTASHRDQTFGLGFRIQKAGYYQTWINKQFGWDYDPIKWNPTVTLVLRRIVRPIPMYAKPVASDPPVLDEPIGYDLTAGDWVSPHGKGKKTDIIITSQYKKKSYNDFEYRIKVGFPNRGDGIQTFTYDSQGSDLHSPREAPTNGYQTNIVREIIRHPGQAGKSDYDQNRKYFFRVRTILDANGNVKSALYGKIYGDFMQFTYYLNPEPNSRNVEFDPNNNLFKGSKSFEKIRSP